MAEKPRSHNEWFRAVSLGNRKSCPNCKAKLPEGERIWSWGEYAAARWFTITHFCVKCFASEVRHKLVNHAGDCGCEIVLRVYAGGCRPPWLSLGKEEACAVGRGEVLHPAGVAG